MSEKKMIYGFILLYRSNYYLKIFELHLLLILFVQTSKISKKLIFYFIIIKIYFSFNERKPNGHSTNDMINK